MEGEVGGRGRGGRQRERWEAEGEIGRAPSELQSRQNISYAVFCLKKKKKEEQGYKTRR